MKEFAIVAMQRSGTTVLTALLGGDPRFYVAREIFHPQASEADSFRTFCASRLRDGYQGSLAERSALFGPFVQSLREKSGKPIIGYNVKYGSIHHLDGDWRSLSGRPSFFDILEQRGAGIIHLVRGNVFKSALSNARAAATDLRRAPAGALTPRPAVTVGVGELQRLIETTVREIEAATRWLIGFPRLMTIRYLEMFDGDRFDAGFVQRLNRFFGLRDAFAGAPALAKLASDDWRADVDNWREVERMMNLNFPRISVD